MGTTESIDIVYELKDTRSPFKKSVPYLVAGGVLLAAALFTGGIFGWILGAVGVLALMIFGANMFGSSGESVILAADRLIIKNKGGERTVMLSEIAKSELMVVQNGSLKRIPFADIDSFAIDEKTQLSVADVSGQRVEVNAGSFNMSDFRSFLDVFKANANGGLLADDAQLKELMQQNEKYLRSDKQLKQELEKTLAEAYKALYVTRGNYYLQQNQQANVIYKYSPNPNEPTYFIENDYLPEHTPENIEAGKNLLEATAKNMQVVDLRIETYLQIQQKLQKLKAAQDAKLKMRQVAGKLETLQNRNNAASLDSYERDEHALQVETMEQLKLLTEQVNGMDDLDKAILLKEKANALNS